MRGEINVSVTEKLPFTLVLMLLPIFLFSQVKDSVNHPIVSQLAIRGDFGKIAKTNLFLKGDNLESRIYNYYGSLSLSYSFRYPKNSFNSLVYGNPYQGIGVGKYFIHGNHELGEPITLYLFQGATLFRVNRFVNLNYEWNFGLSGNWLPYDEKLNYKNKVIGSKINAYINASFYLNFHLNNGICFNIGPSLTHFSNGNTSYPNKGLNLIGLKSWVSVDLSHSDSDKSVKCSTPSIQKFKPYVDYDLLFFGSWRRAVSIKDGDNVVSPGPYGVGGMTFAPMYNVNYRFRTGVSLDFVYDSSLSIRHFYDENNLLKLSKGDFYNRLVLGVSARAEYVMPLFSVGVGYGYNVIENGRDSRGTYQLASLKYYLSQKVFLNFGYKLRKFKNPNYLMLGLGLKIK